MMNYKNILIGSLIEGRINELEIDKERLLKFIGIDNEQLQRIISKNIVNVETLLRFSKILEYDFFRLYSHHLLLFSNVTLQSKPSISKKNLNKSTNVPNIRKQLYTKEIIKFILQKYESKSMTVQQIIEDYNIPKTTLYRWIRKYYKDETKLS